MLSLDKVKAGVVALAKATGRYRDWPAGDHLAIQADPVYFSGDIPPMAGTERNQFRMVLSREQPLITHAKCITYTRRGMAWSDGCLERKFSFEEVGLSHIVDGPGRPSERYDSGSILQSQTPRTYGDWVSEHLASISLALARNCLVQPLLLPGHWYDKPYVQRDLAKLRIKAIAVNAPVLIDEATVINKRRHGHYWIREEAEAVMSALKICRNACDSGTAIYLSRKDEKGEGPKRQINNVVTESAMEQAGVKVFRTRGKSEEDYARLAKDADTVFADHGSAMYNIMNWQTRRIVELFTPEYWDSAFLFLADSIGIVDYNLWQIDSNTTVPRLGERITTLMDAQPSHFQAV